MSKKYLYENEDKLLLREKNWNQRFVLGKIPKFDAYNDINYLSLGLLKSKLRYEEKIKKPDPRMKYNERIYSANYMKSKSIAKQKNENILKNNLKKERFPSLRINLNQDFKTKNIKKNNIKTSYNFPYQGTLTSHNIAGSYLFKFNPDYKNPKKNYNYIDLICQEDSEISDEYELLKDLWDKLGVTENYIKNFTFLLNNKYNNRDELLEMIKGEKKQMKIFRVEFMKALSEINKRENKIKDLKNFIKIYEQVLTDEKRYKLINDDKIKDIGETNKEKIEGDIHDCLKSLRLKTINTVNAFQKFKKNYEHLFNTKFDLEIIKEKYGFNEQYLSKLKNDLDFLRDSPINILYHFSEKGGDPFLLCISDLCGNLNDIKKYRQVPISEEVLSIVKKFMFYIEQEDVFNLTRQKEENNKDSSNNYMKINTSYNNYNNRTKKNLGQKYKNINNKNNDYLINEKIIFNNKSYKSNNKLNNAFEKNLLSTNFKGNIEKEKLRLKSQNEYKNLFFNTEDTYEIYPEGKYLQTNAQSKNPNNQNENIQYNTVKTEEKKYHVPGMTSKQLFRQLDKYSKIQHELLPSTNKDKLKEKVKKNIIKNIEDRMKKVEIEFKIKMEEKLKKEEEKIKEEEKKIKIEKEKIEKICKAEEEERKQKEENYLKLEKEIEERKKKDKKIREENEKMEKRENAIFVKEMQAKFLNEVDQRFKKEDERQYEFKKEMIEKAEQREKERKEETERIRHEEFEKIKRGEVIVDLREKKKKAKKIKKKKKVIKKINKEKEKLKSEKSESTNKKNSEKNEEEESEDEEEEEEDDDEEEEEEESDGKDDKKNNNNNNNNKKSSENDDNISSSNNNKKEKNQKESSNSNENISENIEEEI